MGFLSTKQACEPSAYVDNGNSDGDGHDHDSNYPNPPKKNDQLPDKNLLRKLPQKRIKLIK